MILGVAHSSTTVERQRIPVHRKIILAIRHSLRTALKASYNRLQNSWDTLQHFGIFFMNFAPEPKNMPFAQFTPRPPNQCWSLLPALWSFRIWPTLCRGEGGCFSWDWDIRNFAKKPSSVSSVLQPIVVYRTGGLPVPLAAFRSYHTWPGPLWSSYKSWCHTDPSITSHQNREQTSTAK